MLLFTANSVHGIDLIMNVIVSAFFFWGRKAVLARNMGTKMMLAAVVVPFANHFMYPL